MNTTDKESHKRCEGSRIQRKKYQITLSEDVKSLLEKISTNTQRVFNNTKQRRNKNLRSSSFCKSTSTPNVDQTNWVINLSSRTLSNAETTLLKKGLNFTIMPTNILATEIIVKEETAIRPLNMEQADTFRRTVNNVFQKSQTGPFHHDPTSRQRLCKCSPWHSNLPLQDVHTDQDRTVQTPAQRANRLLEPKSHGKATTTQTKQEHIGDWIQQDQAKAEATSQNLNCTKNTWSQRTPQTCSVLCQHPCLWSIGSPS